MKLVIILPLKQFEVSNFQHGIATIMEPISPIDLITAVILTALTSSTIIAGTLAILGYIAKNLFEKYLSQKVEVFKAELEKTSAEHHIRFQSLHAKRAQIIDELYQYMNQIMRDIDLAIYEHGWEPAAQKEKLQQAYNTGRELQNFFSRNRIYFNRDFCEREQDFLNDIYELTSKFLPILNSSGDDTNQEILAQWSKAHKALYSEINPLNRELEEMFRGLIGVE